LMMSHFLIKLCTLGGTLAPLLKAGFLKKVFTFIQECPVELLPNISKSSNQMNNFHLKNKIIAFITKLKSLDGGSLHNEKNSQRYLSFMAGALLGLYHSKEQSLWELKGYLRDCKDQDMNGVRNAACLNGFHEAYYNLGLLFGFVVGNPYVILVYKAHDPLSKDLVLWSGEGEYFGYCIAIPFEILALINQLKDSFETANSGDFVVTLNCLIQYLKSRCDYKRKGNKSFNDNNKPVSKLMLELLISQFEKLSRGKSLHGMGAGSPRF
ncbi:MAG: hypothetical protein NZT61_07375, partial [Deltaproteobacteria bacterium]|nr:hypothetical protein [Deltaproteobacteria bacterium]